MKTLKFVIAIFVIAGLNLSATAQTSEQNRANMASTKTESFKVSGKCSMCKARIEKAVKAEGAADASWDEKTQLLTVTYDPAKTSQDALSRKIASVGHDTEKYKAPDDVYSKLPGCCHYTREK